MPTEPSRAVFLSYASQDAAAARRICETLRGSGIEVWFDADGGLEHGDEWDAKIRRQIKECVLFIAVISANTQARHEGYFRIEWELAAQRAMGIASGVPFILPVVIDDTREPDALVPDRFRAVQWTKLRAGEVTPEVQQRFLKLWSHRTGVLKHEVARSESEQSRPRPGQRDDGPASPTETPQVGRRVPAAAWIAAAALALLAGGYFFAKRPSESPPPAAQSAGAGTRPPTPEKPAVPLSEARKLVLQARTLIDDDWLAVRENFRLADELCERATRLDPLDGEAWATWARVSTQLIERNYDTSSLRRDGARGRAERAMQLAPDSVEARLAMALMLAQNGSATDAAQRLRDLLAQAPMDARVALALATTLSPPGKPANAEATEIRLHHPSFAGRDPRPLFDEARTMHDTRRRLAECEALMARAAPLSPCWEGYAWNLGYGIFASGDLDASEKVMREIPPRLLQEDVFAVLVANLWIYKGDGEKARAALARVPRDIMEDRWFFEPTAKLRGDAYALSGRAAAAAEQWKQALVVVEKRLIAEPADQRLQVLKVGLFARLGRRDEARQTWQLASELGRVPYPATTEAIMHLANGDREDAILCLQRGLSPMRANMSTSVNVVRFNPVFAPIRSDPRVAKILIDGEAMIAKLRQKPNSTGEESVAAARPTAVPDPKSVAVLAFANVSSDPENEYFSDGIADELSTILQKIPGLRVAARTSAFSFKGKNATAKEVGEKLSMAHLVEGTVQKSGKSVVITARLSRAATNEEIWSERYGPLEPNDVFATQSLIAQKIVAGLRGLLTGETATTAAVTAHAAQAEIKAQVQAAIKGGTKNPEAHQLYLQANFFLNQNTVPSAIRAAELLHKAIRLDQKFALAWVALAQAGWVRGGFGETKADFEEGFKLARESAAQALVIEPDLASAHLALAILQGGQDFNWKAAAESVRRAQDLAPNDTIVIARAAWLAGVSKQTENAVELYRQAVALDPVNPLLRVFFGYVYYGAGRFEEAKAEFQRVRELSPSAPWGHGGVSMVLTAEGRFDEAVSVAEQEKTTWCRLFAVAIARWGQKNGPASDAALAELIKTYADVAAVQVAWVYAFRGQNDLAFDWLERAYRQHDGGLQLSKTHQVLNTLHSDPRWPVFLRKLGLHDDQLK